MQKKENYHLGVVYFVLNKIKNAFKLAVFIVLFSTLAVLSATSFSPNISNANAYGVKEFIENIFLPKDTTEISAEMPEVYVGGEPLGFCLYCDGVVVIAVGNVHTQSGITNTIINGKIVAGDVVKKIDGVSIKSVETIEQEMQKQHKENKIVNLEVEHDGTHANVEVLPAKDIMTNQYKLGLWVRDNSAGVGTLTYIRADNSRFGALGHSVCDIDTGTNLPIESGNIYKCNIIGVSSSKKGSAGELKGLFLKNGTVIGSIDTNNQFGVYGLAGEGLISSTTKKVKVASKNQVQTGKATMICCLSGTIAKEYSIEIIKASKYYNGNKGLVIRVIDPELINQTGGIVQGMSGSPILQNGMLVGAVTHVFLNDPTKGYGIYAESMINN